AVYKCYISRYTFYSSDTSLIPFINVIKENENASEQIAFAISPEINKEYRYSKTINQVSLTPSLAENFKLKEEKWRKLSYSFLASKPIYVQRSNTLNNLTDYEYFIFKQLKKGSITGNMLHHIFENIDFLNNQNWENKIHAALTRFMPRQLENYKTPLLQLVKEVLNARIEVGDKSFKLSEIPKVKRLDELEFDFNVPLFQTGKLNALSEAESSYVVNSYGDLEGIMNGKIDLFFQHEGLFYIVD